MEVPPRFFDPLLLSALLLHVLEQLVQRTHRDLERALDVRAAPRVLAHVQVAAAAQEGGGGWMQRALREREQAWRQRTQVKSSR